MISRSVQNKYQLLRDLMADMDRVIVAYSGGIDSTLLLRVGTEMLGDNCLGVIGISPSLARSELDDALMTARTFNGQVVQVETHEMENPNYVNNDNMRCFHCKYELFSVLINYARDKNYNFILDGNNVDDLADYRPGLKAAKQLNVRSPFVEVGINKDEIRQLAKYLKLPNWNKPAQPCLSSRMAYGQQIDLETLNKIAKAESFLKENGFEIVRIRYRGDHISVEVGPHELKKLFDPSKQRMIHSRLKEMGFPKIDFDKEGYRSGKLNQDIAIV